MSYYVYCHEDPETEEVVYIGYGSRDRAWKFPALCISHPSANRQPNHIKWMEEKVKQNYLPFDWVKLVRRFETKDKAREFEKLCIRSVNPKFNLHNCKRSSRRTHSDVESMKSLRDSGKTYQQIGMEFNISRNTVKRYLDGVSKPREN